MSSDYQPQHDRRPPSTAGHELALRRDQAVLLLLGETLEEEAAPATVDVDGRSKMAAGPHAILQTTKFPFREIGLARLAGPSPLHSRRCREDATAQRMTVRINHNRPKGTYDYVVVGAGASCSVIAGELSGLLSRVSLW